MKWKKGEYPISWNGGKRTVKGYLSPKGVFGICQSRRWTPWTLTHIPSGCAVWRFFGTRKEAEGYVPALEAIPGIRLVQGKKAGCKAIERLRTILLPLRSG